MGSVCVFLKDLFNFFLYSDILQQVLRQVRGGQVAARQIQEVYRAEAVVRPVHRGMSCNFRFLYPDICKL